MANASVPKTFLGKFWANFTPFGQILGMKLPGDPSEIPIRQRLPATVSRSLMMHRRRPTDRSSRQSRMSRFLQQRSGAVTRKSRQSHQREKDETQLPLPIQPAIPRNRHKPLGSRDIPRKSGMATALLAPECARPSRNRACSTFRNADNFHAAEARIHMRLEKITCSQSVPVERKAFTTSEARFRLATSISRSRSLASGQPITMRPPI